MYCECLPARRLRGRLECIWTIQVSQSVTQAVRPDGCIDILYSREGGLSRLEVVGTMTTARSHFLSPGMQFTGLRFHPGKSSFPAADLVDKVIPLRDIRNVGDLHQRLDDSSDAGSVLSEWVATNCETPGNVELALMYLDSGRDVDEVARAANLSVRQFRRRCVELTGLSPCHLARILRFRKACHIAAESRRPMWASIAREAGYFDQAHLIRDFREFAGTTPMAVFSNTPKPTAL